MMNEVCDAGQADKENQYREDRCAEATPSLFAEIQDPGRSPAEENVIPVNYLHALHDKTWTVSYTTYTENSRRDQAANEAGSGLW